MTIFKFTGTLIGQTCLRSQHVASAMLKTVREKPWAALTLFAVLTLILGATVVKDLVNPLLGRDDTDHWLCEGYYFSQHISFTPLPRLDLVNDDVFYPYGVSNVYRAWNLEIAYVYAAAYTVFGHGPWLQWYFLASVLLCAVFVYFVVRRDFGNGWAVFAAIALAFGNFYSLGRFPDHLSLTAVHWLTLSILLDFVITRRFVAKDTVTLRLVLLKAIAQLMCFGHELGYVCGISLTCTLITGCWLICLAGMQCHVSPAKWRNLGIWMWSGLAASWRQHRRWNIALAGMVFVAAFLYLPLVLQLFGEAHRNGSQTMPGIAMFPVNRDRLFLPIFPGLCSRTLCQQFVGELFSFRPGLFFSLAGVLGLVVGSYYNRGWRVLFPFALLIVFVFTLDLKFVQFARLLPWHAQARVPSRLSLVLPVALLVMAMYLPIRLWSTRLGRPLFWIGMCIFTIECATAHYCFYRYSNKHRYTVDDSTFELAKVIANSPGAAVMEWPFTVRSGNLVGNRELGIYDWRQRRSPAFQTLHHKKIMGSYFGRLHPSQIRPFLDAGWSSLFLPNTRNPIFVSQQHRDFTESEWRFFEQFFRANDFCGLLVYADLLHPDTVRGFHDRFGEPVAVTHWQGCGEVQFIPRPANWGRNANSHGGKGVTFRPPAISLGDGEMVSFVGDEGIGYLKSGWSHSEPAGRWSHTDDAELTFSSDGSNDQPVALELQLRAFRGQSFELYLNDKLIKRVTGLPDQTTTLRVDVPSDCLEAVNLLRFHLPNACSPFSLGHDGDRRQLGVQLRSMRFSPTGTVADARSIVPTNR